MEEYCERKYTAMYHLGKFMNESEPTAPSIQNRFEDKLHQGLKELFSMMRVSIMLSCFLK